MESEVVNVHAAVKLFYCFYPEDGEKCLYISWLKMWSKFPLQNNKQNKSGPEGKIIVMYLNPQTE